MLTVFAVVLVSTSIFVVAERLINPPEDHVTVVRVEQTQYASNINLQWHGKPTVINIKLLYFYFNQSSGAIIDRETELNESVSYGSVFNVTNPFTNVRWFEIVFHDTLVKVYNDGQLTYKNGTDYPYSPIHDDDIYYGFLNS